MRKTTSVKLIALAGLMLFGVGDLQARGGVGVQEYYQLRDADPIFLKYYRPRKVGGGYKNNMFLNIKQQCNIYVYRCKWGYEAFQGRPVPKIGQWFMDNLTFARWGYKRQRTLVWKLGAFDSGGAARAVIGLLLYPMQGAVDAIAKTISTPLRNNDLWGGYYKQYPIRALWYFGAKDKLNVMIRALHDVSPFRRDRERYGHVTSGMSLLSSWKLNRGQQTKLEQLCVNKIFGQRMSTQYPVYACVRFLGRTSTKNSDAREYLQNYAKGRNRALKIEAIRAVGHLGLRGMKSKLQDNLEAAKRTKTNRVKRRRRYKRTQVTYWDVHHESVPSAIALLGMGDRTALKAIKFWLGTEKRGGQLRLAWSQGFTAVYREAGFASPKALKKLKPLLKKVFKTVKKASRSNRNLRRYVLNAAIGLAQIGDKTGWKHIIEVMKDSEYNDIKMILRAFGGEPDQLYKGGRDITGIGRLPVGKGGFSTRDVAKFIKLINKRFRFWAADDGLRKLAIETVFNLQARIKIVKKRL